jgi:hypothetical protein
MQNIINKLQKVVSLSEQLNESNVELYSDKVINFLMREYGVTSSNAQQYLNTTVYEGSSSNGVVARVLEAEHIDSDDDEVSVTSACANVYSNADAALIATIADTLAASAYECDTDWLTFGTELLLETVAK